MGLESGGEKKRKETKNPTKKSKKR